jgi:hypothetical protein
MAGAQTGGGGTSTAWDCLGFDAVLQLVGACH